MDLLPKDNQEAYDQYVINAVNVIHDDKASEGIVKRLGMADDLVEEIGEIAVTVAERIDAAAGEKEYQLKANTIINGMNFIVGELIEVAENAGAEPLEEEQRYQAYSWALSRYLEDAVKAGKITPQDLQQLQAAMEQEAGVEGQPQGQPQGQQMPQQGPPQGPPPQGPPQQPIPQQQPGILGGV